MYRARRRDNWNIAANVMTLLANCHRDPKRLRRPFNVADFLPPDLRRGLRTASGIRLTSRTLRMLKPLFTKEA
jgi:hypothetical protein